MIDRDFSGGAASAPAAIPEAIGEVVTYRRNDFVFRQADSADSIHYLEAGFVRQDVASREGKHAVVAIHGPGAFFGEASLVGQNVRSASAIAMTDVRTLRIARPTLIDALKSDEALAAQFVSHIVRRAARLEEDLVDRLFNSTEKRLARALLLLADLGGAQDPNPLLTTITQQTLAEIVGTTRPRVSHFLGKFRRLGFLSPTAPLRVHSSLLNVMLRD